VALVGRRQVVERFHVAGAPEAIVLDGSPLSPLRTSSRAIPGLLEAAALIAGLVFATQQQPP